MSVHGKGRRAYTIIPEGRIEKRGEQVRRSLGKGGRDKFKSTSEGPIRGGGDGKKTLPTRERTHV